MEAHGILARHRVVGVVRSDVDRYISAAVHIGVWSVLRWSHCILIGCVVASVIPAMV